MRKIWVTVMVVMLAIATTVGVAYGVTQTYKTITGTGNVEYVDEVTVGSMMVASPTKIQVRLTSTATTQPATIYTVELFLDGVPTTTSTVSWTVGQIPGTTKQVQWTVLTLGSVVQIGVEVTR